MLPTTPAQLSSDGIILDAIDGLAAELRGLRYLDDVRALANGGRGSRERTAVRGQAGGETGASGPRQQLMTLTPINPRC
jgi:hypothetical protein